MKYALISLTLISSATGFAAGAEDKLSPTDVKALLMVAEDVQTTSQPFTPGVDLKAKTVEVTPTDLAVRDEWVAMMTEGKETDPFHGGDRHRIGEPTEETHAFYASRLKKCNVAPWKFKIDVAVIKVWRMETGLSEPFSQAIGNFLSYDCSIPLTAKIKTFHLRLAVPYPDPAYGKHDLHGYQYAFDKKTGELTIGVDHTAGNIDDFAKTFLRSMAE